MGTYVSESVWRWNFKSRLNYFLLKKFFITSIIVNDTDVNFKTSETLVNDNFFLFYSKLFLKNHTSYRASKFTINPLFFQEISTLDKDDIELIFCFLKHHPAIDPFIFVFCLPNDSIYYKILSPLYSKYILDPAFYNKNIVVNGLEINIILFLIYNANIIQTIQSSGIFSAYTFNTYNKFLVYFYMSLKYRVDNDIVDKYVEFFNINQSIYAQQCNRTKHIINKLVARKRLGCCALELPVLQFEYSNFLELVKIDVDQIDDYITKSFGIYDPSTSIISVDTGQPNIDTISLRNTEIVVHVSSSAFYKIIPNVFYDGIKSFLIMVTNVELNFGTWQNNTYIIESNISKKYVELKCHHIYIDSVSKLDSFGLKFVNSVKTVEWEDVVKIGSFKQCNIKIHEYSQVSLMYSKIYKPIKILFNTVNDIAFKNRPNNLYHYKISTDPFIIARVNMSYTPSWIFNITTPQILEFEEIKATPKFPSGIDYILNKYNALGYFKSSGGNDIVYSLVPSNSNLSTLCTLNDSNPRDMKSIDTIISAMFNRCGKLKSTSYMLNFFDSQKNYVKEVNLDSYKNMLTAKLSKFDTQRPEYVKYILSSVLFDLAEIYQMNDGLFEHGWTLYDHIIVSYSASLVPRICCINTSSEQIKFDNRYMIGCVGYINFYPLVKEIDTSDLKTNIRILNGVYSKVTQDQKIEGFKAGDSGFRSGLCTSNIVEQSNGCILIHFKLIDSTLIQQSYGYVIIVSIDFYLNSNLLTSGIFCFTRDHVRTTTDIRNYICR